MGDNSPLRKREAWNAIIADLREDYTYPGNEELADNANAALDRAETLLASDDPFGTQDDQLLAAVLRRFLTHDGNGYVHVADNGVVIDGDIDITPDEHSALLRVINVPKED